MNQLFILRQHLVKNQEKQALNFLKLKLCGF